MTVSTKQIAINQLIVIPVQWCGQDPTCGAQLICNKVGASKMLASIITHHFKKLELNGEGMNIFDKIHIRTMISSNL